ncbi:MAG: hypothetical protein MUF64_02845 [Polyangiaceae bacterium]|nr:hypothetical protein [Polyangiaceae bacterium]
MTTPPPSSLNQPTSRSSPGARCSSPIVWNFHIRSAPPLPSNPRSASDATRSPSLHRTITRPANRAPSSPSFRSRTDQLPSNSTATPRSKARGATPRCTARSVVRLQFSRSPRTGSRYQSSPPSAAGRPRSSDATREATAEAGASIRWTSAAPGHSPPPSAARPRRRRSGSRATRYA